MQEINVIIVNQQVDKFVEKPVLSLNVFSLIHKVDSILS